MRTVLQGYKETEEDQSLLTPYGEFVRQMNARRKPEEILTFAQLLGLQNYASTDFELGDGLLFEANGLHYSHDGIGLRITTFQELVLAQYVLNGFNEISIPLCREVWEDDGNVCVSDWVVDFSRYTTESDLSPTDKEHLSTEFAFIFNALPIDQVYIGGGKKSMTTATCTICPVDINQGT